METGMQPPISRRVNVGMAERGVSLATGLATMYYLLKRRPSVKISLPLALDAGYMIYRGATGHCFLYRLLEINRLEGGNKGIQVQRSVTVNLPREQLYRIWRNFENLPRFMKHMQRVDVNESTGGKRSHWAAKSPFGREIGWVAPSRLRTSEWGLPVLFRVSVAYDLLGSATNRVTVLGEFNQPNNTKPAAGMGLEWGLGNLGNSGFSLAARGSYTIQPDNQVDDVSFGGLATAEGSGSFTSDGLALGGGIEYGRRNVRLAFDDAYRDMGPLGGTNFLTFSFGW